MRALMVIAPEIFRDEEYAVPKQVLESRGVTVVTASTRAGSCRGKLGMTAEADIALGDADAEEYAAVIFVGGGGADVYFDDPVAHALARSALEKRRVLGAICIAPSVLAHAGLLAGVRATSFPSQREDLVAHKAVWSDGPVEVAGPIITANGPEAARDFGLALVDALGVA